MKRLLNRSLQQGGCSEGLDAFRFFFFKLELYLYLIPGRQYGTELAESSHLNTASTSAVIAPGSKAGKDKLGLDWR